MKRMQACFSWRGPLFSNEFFASLVSPPHGYRTRTDPMTILCQIDSIPEGNAKSLEHEGKQMFAVKHRGKIYLYLNQCPHMGVNLNWQDDDFFNYDDSLLQCSMHGALFEIESGLCIAGPCKRQSLFPIPFKLSGKHIELKDLTDS